MNKYRKLIAAVVGVIAIILGPEILGLTEDTETTVQMFMGLLTAFGVFQIPNETAPRRGGTMTSPPAIGMAAVLFVLLAMQGCANTNTNDFIGGAYAAQTAISQSILSECGNTQPGGACQITSAISTEQKEQAKAALDLIDRYTDAAADLNAAGNKDGALTTLQRANNLLDELERLLIDWGVQ